MQVREWNDQGRLVNDLMDQNLQLNDIQVRQVERGVEIALSCVQTEPARRPPMDFVLQCLEERAEMTDWTMDTGVNRNRNTGANQALGEPSNGEITDADANSGEGVQMLRRGPRSSRYSLNSTHNTQE